MTGDFHNVVKHLRQPFYAATSKPSIRRNECEDPNKWEAKVACVDNFARSIAKCSWEAVSQCGNFAQEFEPTQEPRGTREDQETADFLTTRRSTLASPRCVGILTCECWEPIVPQSRSLHPVVVSQKLGAPEVVSEKIKVGGAPQAKWRPHRCLWWRKSGSPRIGGPGGLLRPSGDPTEVGVGESRGAPAQEDQVDPAKMVLGWTNSVAEVGVSPTERQVSACQDGCQDGLRPERSPAVRPLSVTVRLVGPRQSYPAEGQVSGVPQACGGCQQVRGVPREH